MTLIVIDTAEDTPVPQTDDASVKVPLGRPIQGTEFLRCRVKGTDPRSVLKYQKPVAGTAHAVHVEIFAKDRGIGRDRPLREDRAGFVILRDHPAGALLTRLLIPAVTVKPGIESVFSVSAAIRYVILPQLVGRDLQFPALHIPALRVTGDHRRDRSAHSAPVQDRTDPVLHPDQRDEFRSAVFLL